MRFYFATTVADDMIYDEHGVELRSAEAAVQLALETLGEMAKDGVVQMRGGSALEVEVEDQSGNTICAVRLDFTKTTNL